MREMVITSSILILAILLIRHLAKGRIHPLLQYSLWLLVVFKLLIPIPLWSSQLSVLNLFPGSFENNTLIETEPFTQDKMDITDNQNMPEDISQAAGTMSDQEMFSGKPDPDSLSGMSDTDSLSGMEVITSYGGMASVWDNMISNPYLHVFLTFTWIIGIIVMGGYMIYYQIKWQRFLHNNRKPLSASQSEIVSALGIPLSVYIVNGLPSPCLCGRSIYMTEDMAEDEKQLEHILVHEYCHYRQFDSLWVIVRCVLTVVYWFNPLVWAAAYLSKKDSEFACDVAVIRMLGEDERIPYGKTLINLISGNSFDRSIGAVSMMSDDEKGIRERIFKIARKPKYAAAAAAAIILIAAALIAVTFSGEYRENASGQETEDATDVINAENEENIVDLINTEADDMQVKSERLDEAVQRAEEEKEKVVAEELAKIEEMEAAAQAELSAIKQAEAEIEQAELEAAQAELEAQNSDELAEIEAANMEAVKMAIMVEIEAAENESVLSKPFKSEDIQLLLSQAEYTDLLPHQSAMQISYINPCPSYTRISDTFGTRINPVTNLELFHNGVDLAAAQDEDIVAAAGGIVCKTGYDSYYGKHVVIYHGMENFTYYAHCAEILVSEGDSVESGQKIATVGSTGRSTGPHLHFMVSDNSEYIEPVFQ
ncbi:MAG: peptidoglycan DD-metalloendopeptidase family protein [Lachnospiraceae bacterium]|nr:peptidoglycan DD-metalloendopeptidase family protein [Lachnospiraceae bacterium]